MNEINTFINRYTKDQDYKESIRRFTDKIRNMKSTMGLESDYGRLVFEGPMTFKKQNENK